MLAIETILAGFTTVFALALLALAGVAWTRTRQVKALLLALAFLALFGRAAWVSYGLLVSSLPPDLMTLVFDLAALVLLALATLVRPAPSRVAQEEVSGQPTEA